MFFSIYLLVLKRNLWFFMFFPFNCCPALLTFPPNCTFVEGERFHICSRSNPHTCCYSQSTFAYLFQPVLVSRFPMPLCATAYSYTPHLYSTPVLFPYLSTPHSYLHPTVHLLLFPLHSSPYSHSTNP